MVKDGIATATVGADLNRPREVDSAGLQPEWVWTFSSSPLEGRGAGAHGIG